MEEITVWEKLKHATYKKTQKLANYKENEQFGKPNQAFPIFF